MPFVLPPTNLHCSQTTVSWSSTDSRVLPPTNLHCSQTSLYNLQGQSRFCPLQICTALKHFWIGISNHRRFAPYKFALLSNLSLGLVHGLPVLPPTNLHCSQTAHCSHSHSLYVLPPTNLHCSQTRHCLQHWCKLVLPPTNLHCSQTLLPRYFQTP